MSRSRSGGEKKRQQKTTVILTPLKNLATGKECSDYKQAANKAMNGSRERNGVKRPDRIAGKSGHCAALRSRLPLLLANLLSAWDYKLFRSLACALLRT